MLCIDTANPMNKETILLQRHPHGLLQLICGSRLTSEWPLSSSCSATSALSFSTSCCWSMRCRQYPSSSLSSSCLRASISSSSARFSSSRFVAAASLQNISQWQSVKYIRQAGCGQAKCGQAKYTGRLTRSCHTLPDSHISQRYAWQAQDCSPRKLTCAANNVKQ